MGILAKLMAMVGLSGGSTSAQVNSRGGDEMVQRMRDAFPYRIITVPGHKALAEWEKLKAQGNGWPVVVGDDEALGRILEQFSIDDPAVFAQPAGGQWKPPPLRPVEEILEAADKIDVRAKLQELYDQEYGEDPFEIEPGEWPEPGTMAPMTLMVDRDILTGKTFPQVHIVVVPTGDATAVAAFLRWGGWNACPFPEVHVAVHRTWREEFGAEIAGITGDVIILRAKRRPATRDEAMDLAREQYLYCSDIVLQGTETFEPLAMSLMESDWWYFWWD